MCKLNHKRKIQPGSFLFEAKKWADFKCFYDFETQGIALNTAWRLFFLMAKFIELLGCFPTNLILDRKEKYNFKPIDTQVNVSENVHRR